MTIKKLIAHFWDFLTPKMISGIYFFDSQNGTLTENVFGEGGEGEVAEKIF
jgi:hypothetical protein